MSKVFIIIIRYINTFSLNVEPIMGYELQMKTNNFIKIVFLPKVKLDQ